MDEKEKMYIEKFGYEYLTLKQACEIWRKPGYSALSKKLPEMGYSTAFERKVIPKYKIVSGTYLFKIRDILDFLNSTETINGKQ